MHECRLFKRHSCIGGAMKKVNMARTYFKYTLNDHDDRRVYLIIL